MTFDAQLRDKLKSIHAKLTPGEATAIIDVARLAAAADKKTDLSEVVVLLSLSRIVCEMAGLKEVPQAPTSIDAKRLHEISEQLVAPGARELAYACAYTVMIQDLDLTKEEDQLARGLGDALVIEASRAKQLASEMEAMIRSARGK